MIEKLKKDFEDRWRTAEENVFHEIVTLVSHNRQLGIHPNFVIAMALDPKFKSLKQLCAIRYFREHSPAILFCAPKYHKTCSIGYFGPLFLDEP